MKPRTITPRSAGAELFTDPRTRALLSHTGSTTCLLERLLDERVNVHTMEVSRAAVDRTCPEAAAPLGLPAAAPVLVRRTTLAVARHQVSRNLVLAPLGRLPWAERLLRSCDTPLGPHLPQPHERHPLGLGLDSWGPGRAAVSRWYLVIDPGSALPALFIRETFNPDLFDPATTRP
ncbi:hypothetical protein ACFPOI_28220 [Nonomuraea angiospora]|uniref:Chorismate-pyruvate lyase n=1 Tax=Nonomuraea angiospora TaxID=46172 RepID=A0ABR9LND0_9ACTN|nr:hypothetical protein [Nonomuraea angiospora]MBE1582155.1 chorismate-pyruvate lyase [Nonomuraea angiospora]